MTDLLDKLLGLSCLVTLGWGLTAASTTGLLYLADWLATFTAEQLQYGIFVSGLYSLVLAFLLFVVINARRFD